MEELVQLKELLKADVVELLPSGFNDLKRESQLVSATHMHAGPA